MSGLATLRRFFGRDSAGTIRVHVLLRGRTGSGWHDADEQIALPVGATLTTLFDAAERRGIHLRDAIASSPHLGHTLMVNGERCPVDSNLERALADGDEVFLLAPLAGG